METQFDAFMWLNIFRFLTDSIAIVRLVCKYFDSLALSKKSLLLDYFDDICSERPNTICTNSVTMWMMSLPDCVKLKKNLYKYHQPDRDDTYLTELLVKWGNQNCQSKLKINYTRLFHYYVKHNYIKSLLTLCKSPSVKFNNYISEFLKYGSKFLSFENEKIFLRINMAKLCSLENNRIQYFEFKSLFDLSQDLTSFQDIVFTLIKIEKLYSHSTRLDQNFIQKVIKHGILYHNKSLDYLQWIEQNFSFKKNMKFFVLVLSKCNNEIADYIIKKWPLPKKIDSELYYYLALASERLNCLKFLQFINKFQHLRKSFDFLMALLTYSTHRGDEFIKLYLEFYKFNKNYFVGKSVTMNLGHDIWVMEFFHDTGAKICPHFGACDPQLVNVDFYLRHYGYVNLSWLTFDKLDLLNQDFISYYFYNSSEKSNMPVDEHYRNFCLFLVNHMTSHEKLTNDQWGVCFEIIKTEKLEDQLLIEMNRVANDCLEDFLTMYHKIIYRLYFNNIYKFTKIDKISPRLWSKWKNLFLLK